MSRFVQALGIKTDAVQYSRVYGSVNYMICLVNCLHKCFVMADSCIILQVRFLFCPLYSNWEAV